MTNQKTTAGAQQAKAALKAGSETVEKVVKAGKETIDTATKAGAEALTKGYEQAAALTKEQIKSYFPAAEKSFEELLSFNRGNLDAALAVTTATTKGFQAIGQELVDFNRKAVTEAMDRAAALANCKTLQDVVSLQTEFARANLEAFVAQGRKISELSLQMATEATEPLAGRITEAVEKFAKPVAA